MSASAPLKIETLAIGDELLTGRIADTNSQWVAAQCFALGVQLQQVQSVADDEGAMVEVLTQVARRAEIVICFGGLGPTTDDKTAQCIAELLGTELIQHPPSLARLHDYLASRGRTVTPWILKQVQFPRGTEALSNPVGLAPGFSCQIDRAQVFFLPGVPAEMKPMFTTSVLPHIETVLRRKGSPHQHTRMWRCLDLPESELQKTMAPFEAKLGPNARLGYRTRFPENHLTLYWLSPNPQPDADFIQVCHEISVVLRPWCYTESDEELEALILARLKQRGERIALAESCTGGLCAQRLSALPGASEVFWGSAVAYQVSAKNSLLGVQCASEDQAVSAWCSRELAQSAKRLSGSQWGAAVTGVMGPAGGTANDPVGTSYLCVVGPNGCLERRIMHPGYSRQANQWGASTYLFELVLKALGHFE